MIITCPECASEFDVPVALIGPSGRKVRCASCRHEWHTQGQVLNKPVENPYKSSDTQVSDTGFEIEFDIFKNTLDDAKPKPKKKSSSGKTQFFRKIQFNIKIVSVALVCLLIMAGILFALRPFLAELSPETAQIYRGVGLGMPIVGNELGIDRLSIKQVWTEAGNALEISSKIINLAETPQLIPPVIIHVVDNSGNVTGKSWRYEPPKLELEANETLPFAVKTADMPASNDEVIRLRASFEL